MIKDKKKFHWSKNLLGISFFLAVINFSPIFFILLLKMKKLEASLVARQQLVCSSVTCLFRLMLENK